MPNLVKKVQNTIFQHSLLEKGDRIVLAVSGGPDSAAMLDIFSKLKKKYDLELIIAHVNYALRGRDSEQDENFVRKLAEKYALPIFVLRPEYEKNISEEYLRDIRYSFFEEIRKKQRFTFISVAHNLDDQVETYLLRLIRGAGLQGLSAMRHKNNLLIRPLLDTPRKEILTYLKENKLKYRIDKTNRELKFTRNKIRHQLIPYLEKNFNPSIKKTVSDSISSIAEDYDLISRLADRTGRKFEKTVRISELLALHPALQKRILRRIINGIRSDLKNIETSHIEEILKAARSTKRKNQVVVFKGLKIRRIGDRLEISHNT